MANSEIAIDVDESTFATEVIARSQEMPVVVDFWAPWCGPCRVLSPVLISLAQEYRGRFVLAKLNVDDNQRLAAQYGVQGIPLVKAFKDGRVVDEFVGAQPHPTVRQFIERLLPDPLEAQVSAAKVLLADGNFVDAETAFRAVLAGDPQKHSALMGLATALLRQGNTDAALEMLANIPAGTSVEAEVARLRREVTLRAEANNTDEAELRARVAEAPGDLDARYALASILVLQSCHAEALEHYLEIVRRNRSFRNGAARQAMLDVFETLGEDPLVRTYRDKLAMALFV